MEDVFPHQFLKQTKNNRIQFCVCKRIRACCHMSLYEMYREKITTKKKIQSFISIRTVPQSADSDKS